MRLVIVALLVLATRTAVAYPQFQLSKDATCSGCHLSPAGGGLLSENGRTTAETISQLGTDASVFYGALTLPSWLVLGGDLRGAAGVSAAPSARAVMFPMQAELAAEATLGAWSAHVTAGMRDPQDGNLARTLFASREHWVQWHDDPGASAGWFARAGRFMPVFGLRLAEHVAFDRRYGGTPLYGEAYGVEGTYVSPAWEVHATAFVHDRLVPDSIERGDGATVYAEARVTDATAIGVESKLDLTVDDRKVFAGATAKHYFDAPEILVEAEAQVIDQHVRAGGADVQLVGYVLGSLFLGAFMIDLGVGAYAPDTSVRYLDREVADVNVHWFATSHLELLWTSRFEMLELGEGGPSSGYSLVQAHYRL